MKMKSKDKFIDKMDNTLAIVVSGNEEMVKEEKPKSKHVSICIEKRNVDGNDSIVYVLTKDAYEDWKVEYTDVDKFVKDVVLPLLKQYSSEIG